MKEETNKPEKQNKALKNNVFSPIIILFLVVFFIAAGGLFFHTQYNKRKNDLSVKPSPSLPVQPSEKTQNAKLAYKKDGTLYVLQAGERKKIAEEGYRLIVNLKWSPTGRYLGWINRRVGFCTAEDEKTCLGNYGITVSVWDSQSQKIMTVIDEKEADEIKNKNDKYFKELSDFDFASEDPLKIVYVRNGIWEKNVNTGKEEIILSHPERITPEGEGYFNNKVYRKLTINESGDLLLWGTIWDVGFSHFYDSDKKEVIEFLQDDRVEANSQFLNSPIWFKNNALTFSSSYFRWNAGIWKTDLSTAITENLINQYPCGEKFLMPAVLSVSISDEGKIAVLAEENFCGENQHDLKLKGKSLYLVRSDKSLNPVMQVEEKTFFSNALSWIPGEEAVSILVNNNENKADIEKVNFENRKKTVIVEGIDVASSFEKPFKAGVYAWSNLNSSLDWKIFENKNFSFKYPEEWEEPKINQLSTRNQITIKNGKELEQHPPKLQIEIGNWYSQELQKSFSLEELIDNLGIQNTEDTVFERFSLKSRKGYRYTYHHHGLGFYTTSIYLAKSEKPYDLLYIEYRHAVKSPESNLRIPQTLNKILSSFKFKENTQ